MCYDTDPFTPQEFGDLDFFQEKSNPNTVNIGNGIEVKLPESDDEPEFPIGPPSNADKSDDRSNFSNPPTARSRYNTRTKSFLSDENEIPTTSRSVKKTGPTISDVYSHTTL